MVEISRESLENYLREALGGNVSLKEAGEIVSLDREGMKEFGYGKPLRIAFERDGVAQEAVISVVRPDRYGHQFLWDRAAIVLFQYYAGARMEKYPKSLGLGYIDASARLVPVREPGEFFLLREMVKGRGYHLDLERMESGGFQPDDERLVRDFARWLARVHSRKLDSPDIYLRQVRRLLGDSECIWGLIDAYPFPYEQYPPERFIRLEKRLIDWRWRLRSYVHRLSAVHGDFHPWNVLVKPDGDFCALDRSRGEWGEPADDIAAMSVNYLLYSLYVHSRLSGVFERLYLAFWEEYLGQTGDDEILAVIAPFYVFRGLVIAHPEWYPDHPDRVRLALLRFIENVLEEEYFDYRDINRYLA